MQFWRGLFFKRRKQQIEAHIFWRSHHDLGLASIFNVSESCATDIWYLRSRNRWTQVLEDELIALFKAGTRPNMNEFGCTPETGEALLNAAIGSVVNNYTPTPDAY